MSLPGKRTVDFDYLLWIVEELTMNTGDHWRCPYCQCINPVDIEHVTQACRWCGKELDTI